MARYSRNDSSGIELPKASIDRESLREAWELFGYLKPYRTRFFTALCVLFVGNLLGLAFPYLAGTIIDQAVVGASTKGQGADRQALLLMGVLALQATCSFYHSLSFATVGQKALVDLRREVYARLITLPMSFFSQRRVGELASRLSSDLVQIEDTLIAILPQFVRHATLLGGGMVLIAATSLKLTAIMLASLPLLIAVSIGFGRRTRRLSREAQDRLAETATVVEETLQGILNVKAFSNESYEVGRYDQALRQFLSLALRGARLRAGFIAFVVFALFGAVVLVLWSGARLMQQGKSPLANSHGLFCIRPLSPVRWGNLPKFTASSRRRSDQLSECGNCCAKRVNSNRRRWRAGPLLLESLYLDYVVKFGWKRCNSVIHLGWM